MERYRTSRKDREPVLQFIYDALERGGATILTPADPTSAPFQITIRTAAGEVLRLTCYAFYANKYRGKRRPSDEHRFQVKYGSDFQRYHQLYIPAEDDQVTLMFGVHLDEQVVVAVDPAMHETTWFSKSVEFKTGNLASIHAEGWTGWERERKEARRKDEKPLLNYQTEVLLGLKPHHFVRYVQFERVATGLDPGERLLWIDKLADAPPAKSKLEPHPLEVELGLPAREILDMIADGAARLKTAVRGRAAEQFLEAHIKAAPGVSNVIGIDEDGRPDFEVGYKHRKPVFIECKNVLRRLTKAGPRVDFQKTRASKGNPCSRFYKASEFEVLAACLHPVTQSWDFRFRATQTIAEHAKCKGHLTSKVDLGGNGPYWTSSISELLEAITT